VNKRSQEPHPKESGEKGGGTRDSPKRSHWDRLARAKINSKRGGEMATIKKKKKQKKESKRVSETTRMEAEKAMS